MSSFELELRPDRPDLWGRVCNSLVKTLTLTVIKIRHFGHRHRLAVGTHLCPGVFLLDYRS